MEILIQVLQFILSFSLLVVVHECGHFFFARLFGTRVEKFYLFFDPWFSLLKFKRGDTEYGLGWIPFGGYVKISGMIDESMDSEQMKQPMQSWEFRAKPAWQRLLIMVGGVLMNLVLAGAIYIGISYAWGDRYVANQDVKYGYAFNGLAQEVGFQNGDKIINVAGETVIDAGKIFSTIVINQAEYVTVERGGAPVRVEIPQDRLADLLNAKDFMTLRMPFVVGGVVKSGAAQVAGILPSDTLVAFQGEAMRYFDEYQAALMAHKGQSVQISVMRDSAGVSRLLTLPVQVPQEGLIGVQLGGDQVVPISTRAYTFWQAIPTGIARAGEELSNYGKQLKLIFSPNSEAYKSMGGMLMIGSIFPTEWNWEAFWKLTAFLSIALAVMNILPIPVLDGGHVLFLLVEVVTGRKPSDKFMERAQTVGLVILFALLIYANGNDIYRFFIK